MERGSALQLRPSFAMADLRHSLMRAPRESPGDRERSLNPALLEACGDAEHWELVARPSPRPAS